MMSPKLSIITINYNNAQGLRKTMESVFSQTSDDFEYIVVDGGSTDGSSDIILEYTGHPRFTSGNLSFKWICEPDKGIYQAMNKGILRATGEYCQFLNSGDWLDAHDVTEKMLKSLTDCSIFYGNMLKILPKGRVYRDTCGQGNLTLLSFYKGALNHSPTYIKRNLFDKYGLYDETYKIVSDWKWYISVIILNNESLKYINQDVAWFDMNGISSTNRDLDKEERRKVLKELLPPNILADYDAHWQKIEQGKRINRYNVTKRLFWFVDRALFKIEKWKSI